MKISQERVAEIAKLARLELPQEKQALFAGQFENILTYMDTLHEVDTSNVEPLYSPVAHTTVYRPDTVRNTAQRSDILSNAPETDGQYFVVPKIV